MSELDQQAESRRQRRFLGRVLIVAGATVVGTTGLWPFSDSAMADASAETPRPPLVESASVVGGDLVPDFAADRLPPPGDLRGVSDAAYSADPSSRFVDGGALGGYPASENARPDRLLPAPEPTLLLAPMALLPVLLPAPEPADAGEAVHEHAPEAGAAAVTAGNERIRYPRPAVHSGASGRGTVPRQVLTTAPVSPGAIPGVVDPPHVDDTPTVQPGPAASTAPHGPALPSAAGDRALSTADENADNPGARGEMARNAPIRPGHPVIPADAGLNGCACPIDWAGHGAVAQPSKAGPGGRDVAAPVGRTSSPAAVVAVSDRQPGITPD